VWRILALVRRLLPESQPSTLPSEYRLSAQPGRDRAGWDTVLDGMVLPFHARHPTEDSMCARFMRLSRSVAAARSIGVSRWLRLGSVSLVACSVLQRFPSQRCVLQRRVLHRRLLQR
jgi:hypothetical protein